MELETGLRGWQVVIATGPFQMPFVPGIAEGLGDDVVQMHSTDYRSPESMPDGRVLVVGGGNTGFQIAEELSASREVHLAIGSRQTPLPQRILGRDLFWYLDATGLIRKTTASRIGKLMRKREDTLIGSNPRRAVGTASSSTAEPSVRRDRPSASRTEPTWMFAASSGQPASESITRGSTSQCSMKTAAPCTSAA